MLYLTQGSTSENIVVTLTEKSLLEQPAYLFVFEHVTTKEKVRIVLLNDLSAYPDRYNEFEINTAASFSKVGQYIYRVYEQVSQTNTDETGLNELENGKAELQSAETFAYTTLSSPTTFVTYAENKKENGKYTIISVKFEDSKLPEMKEVRGKEWIQFGDTDDYPDYLLKLSNKSAKHNAIINGKKTYIYGNGLQSQSKNPALTAWVGRCNKANEGMNELAIKAIMDNEVFGGFYWQIIPNKIGKISEIYHIDFKCLRTNDDRTIFYYKKNWKDRTEVPKEFPKYTVGLRTAGIFSFREYRQGQGVYSLPNYISALNYIETDYEVSKQTLSNAKTGFSASKFINFYDGEPDEEGKRKIEKRFTNRYAGSEGRKIIIAFNNDPAKRPTVDDLGGSDLSKEDFTAVDNLITSNIYAGHQITSPMLFGIQEPGKLGSGQELKYAYDIFKNTYANFKQRQIESVINYFGEILGYGNDLKLQDVDPIGIPFTDQTIVQVAPLAWIWEKLGIDPAKYPNAQPAVQPTNPNVTTQPAGAPSAGSEQMVNDNVKNLSAKQHQQLVRIIRQHSKGQITTAAASALLKAGLGLTASDIAELLGTNPAEQEFEKEYTEEEAAGMFEEFGSEKTSFSIVRSKEATFSEDEFEISEVFESVTDATTTENNILDAISTDNTISDQEIADQLGIDISEVQATIEVLQKKGLLDIKPGKALVREVVTPPTGKKSKPPEVSIKYSYEVKPGVGPAIIPGTRLFCKKLIELNRLYSRSEIQQISMRLGYSVWERRGGFWNQGNGNISPACRHVWQSHVVLKKASDE